MEVFRLFGSIFLKDEEVNNSLARVDKNAQTVGERFGAMGEKMTAVGQQMSATLTAPIMAFGVASVFNVAKFDDAMSKVMAISGATGDEFTKLREKALHLGSTTAFSSSQVALAMTELASTGFNTNQILSSVSGVLSLASSAGIDLAEASAIAGAAINGFGLEAEDAGRVSDVLAKAAAISATNATGLGEAFKYIAPVANALGLSIEEVASAVGIMADAGIEGSQAGTTLRAGLLRLTSPTKEMQELMTATSSQFFDANGKMKDMSGILEVLQKATSTMTDKQKAHYLATLFGTESVSGFMALLEAGTGKLNENTDALKNSKGEAEQMAKIMEDNVAGSMRELSSATEGLFIAFGETLAPAIRDLAGFLSDLASKFSNLGEKQRLIIVIMGGLVAAMGPLLIIVGMVTSAIGAAIPVITAAGAVIAGLSAPVWIAIGAVTALVAIGVSLYKNWDEVKAKATAFGTSVKNSISNMASTVTQKFKSMISSAYSWGKNLIQGFIDGITAMVGKVRSTVSNVMNTVQGYLGFNSPAEEGPGRYIEQWGANMIEGFLDGSKSMIPQIRADIGDLVLNMRPIPSPSATGRQMATTTPGDVHLTFTGPINVRNDNDIKLIARELFNLQQRAGRGRGINA